MRSRLLELRAITFRIWEIFRFNAAWSDVAMFLLYNHLCAPTRCLRSFSSDLLASLQTQVQLFSIRKSMLPLLASGSTQTYKHSLNTDDPIGQRIPSNGQPNEQSGLCLGRLPFHFSASASTSHNCIVWFEAARLLCSHFRRPSIKWPNLPHRLGVGCSQELTFAGAENTFWKDT